MQAGTTRLIQPGDQLCTKAAQQTPFAKAMRHGIVTCCSKHSIQVAYSSAEWRREKCLGYSHPSQMYGLLTIGVWISQQHPCKWQSIVQIDSSTILICNPGTIAPTSTVSIGLQGWRQMSMMLMDLRVICMNSWKRSRTANLPGSKYDVVCCASSTLHQIEVQQRNAPHSCLSLSISSAVMQMCGTEMYRADVVPVPFHWPIDLSV